MSTAAPEPQARRLQDWADWIIRLIVPALFSAAIAGIWWAADTENRISNLEKHEARIVAIEAKNDGMYKLAEDIAVLKTKLDAQDKTLDRIEKLLERQ
jgi:hypothetical protein